jgi:hypothetical protein
LGRCDGTSPEYLISNFAVGLPSRLRNLLELTLADFEGFLHDGLVPGLDV